GRSKQQSLGGAGLKLRGLDFPVTPAGNLHGDSLAQQRSRWVGYSDGHHGKMTVVRLLQRGVVCKERVDLSVNPRPDCVANRARTAFWGIAVRTEAAGNRDAAKRRKKSYSGGQHSKETHA